MVFAYCCLTVFQMREARDTLRKVFVNAEELTANITFEGAAALFRDHPSFKAVRDGRDRKVRSHNFMFVSLDHDTHHGHMCRSPNTVTVHLP